MIGFPLKTRIVLQSQTTGTSDLSLYGGQGIDPLDVDIDCSYAIYHQEENEWEEGDGTYNAKDGTLVRTSVTTSSNSDAAVDLSAGIKDVILTDASTGGGGGGSGDVTAASNFGTDNVVIRSNGTGKGVQASGVSISDLDAITGLTKVTVAVASGTADYLMSSAGGSHTGVLSLNASGDLILRQETGGDVYIDAQGSGDIHLRTTDSYTEQVTIANSGLVTIAQDLRISNPGTDPASAITRGVAAATSGASLVGIEDTGGIITATTVEGALAENRAAIDAVEADYLDSSDIGSTVQAFDADLNTWAGITPSANVQALVSAADYAAVRTLLDLEPGVDFYSTGAVDTAIANAVAGLDWKNSVRVATTTAQTLSTDFENGDTIDDVVLATGDRILIKDQGTGSENGIYTVNASGSPTRATDADTDAEVTAGLAVFVSEGTANGNTQWRLTTDDPITVGSTALVFAQIGGGTSYSAGTGIDITSNTISVEFGTSSTTACVGNDSRLSDARTPTSHATSHQSGGGDAIKLDDLAAPDDNTDLNASASAHGLLPKLSNVVTEYLNGQGGFSLPPGSSGGTDVAVADGGTGRSTGTTAYSLIATGTTATGAQQTLANGATTEILVGGGASALPVWTTATGSGAPVRATSPTFVTPALGTPSSGTLTNCTGLLISGLTASTTLAIGVGSIELGHASDTTLARSGAGDVAIEGNAIYRAGGTDVPVADGGTGLSSATAYAVLCGGTTGTGAFQSIASVGTSGQILTSNGPGALPTFQTNSGSGSYVLLSTATASSSTSIDFAFTSWTNSDYFAYIVIFEHVTPATDAVSLIFRTSSDGGSTFDSGTNYIWALQYAFNGGDGSQTGAGDTSISLALDLGNATNENSAGIVMIYNPSLTDRLRITWQTQGINAAGAFINRSGCGGHSVAEDIDAIRFAFSSGNIASGRFKLYGIKAA